MLTEQGHRVRLLFHGSTNHPRPGLHVCTGSAAHSPNIFCSVDFHTDGIVVGRSVQNQVEVYRHRIQYCSMRVHRPHKHPTSQIARSHVLLPLSSFDWYLPRRYYLGFMDSKQPCADLKTSLRDGFVFDDGESWWCCWLEHIPCL